jgi:hypothetical protein
MRECDFYSQNWASTGRITEKYFERDLRHVRVPDALKNDFGGPFFTSN